MNIIQGAKNGEAGAWDQLYRSITPQLLVFLRSQRMQDAIESEEDLVSTTWLSVAEKIHSFSGNEGQFKAWVFTIAKNKAFNANKKAVRRKTSPTDDFTWHEKEQWEEDWSSVEPYLACLSKKEKEVVVLLDLLSFNASEASKVLNRRPSGVRVTHMRALKKLKEVAENQDF